MRKAQNPMRQSWLNEAFIGHRLRLIMSPAWQHRPRPLCRVLERLEIEHMRHGGQENGRLCVSYGQFVQYGVSRRSVGPALAAGVALGLIEIRQLEELQANLRAPNEYRLTYVPEKDRRAPTDEWATVTEEEAIAAEKAFLTTQDRKGRKSEVQFPFLRSTGSLSSTQRASIGSLSSKSLGSERELPLISGRKAAGAALALNEGER